MLRGLNRNNKAHRVVGEGGVGAGVAAADVALRGLPGRARQVNFTIVKGYIVTIFNSKIRPTCRSSGA